MSEKQGPTHYCPGCRWAFWPVLMKPSAEQVKDSKKTNPDASEANMSYIKMRNKPGYEWGKTEETKMIDQLGGQLPCFLSANLMKYWNRKYCEKYPNSERGKRWADEQKRLKDKHSS